MTTKTIVVAKEFSPSPAGRYRADGPFPGQKFREELLVPAIREHDHVVVDMEGMEMSGSSFLDEAFAGLIREHGLSEATLRAKLEVRSPRVSDTTRIWKYIHEEASRAGRKH